MVIRRQQFCSLVHIHNTWTCTTCYKSATRCHCHTAAPYTSIISKSAWAAPGSDIPNIHLSSLYCEKNITDLKKGGGASKQASTAIENLCLLLWFVHTIFIETIFGSWFYSYSKMASSITTTYICCGILYFDTNISKWDWTWNLMTTEVVS